VAFSNVAAKARNGWPFGHVAQAVRFVVEWMWFLIFKHEKKKQELASFESVDCV